MCVEMDGDCIDKWWCKIEEQGNETVMPNSMRNAKAWTKAVFGVFGGGKAHKDVSQV